MGEFEDVSGTRWGEFHLVGTFDGERVTASQVTPTDEFDAPDGDDADQILTSCEEPEGGWVADSSLVGYDDQDAAFRAAGRLPDYAGASSTPAATRGRWSSSTRRSPTAGTTASTSTRGS